MNFDTVYDLKALGFKKIRGFKKYMKRGDVIVNIYFKRVMTIRKDGRVNLSMDNGKRTCVRPSVLKVIWK